MAQVAYAPPGTRALLRVPSGRSTGRAAQQPRAAYPQVTSLARSRTALCLVVFALLVGLVAATYLGYSGSVATSSYSLQRLRTERDAWRARNEQLRLELAKARSLTWVEHEAVSRLNMRRPAQLTYLRVEPSLAQPSGADHRPAATR